MATQSTASSLIVIVHSIKTKVQVYRKSENKYTLLVPTVCNMATYIRACLLTTLDFSIIDRAIFTNRLIGLPNFFHL